MRIIIGLVIIIAGIGYAVYQTKKMNKLNLEIQSVETSKIADAIDIVNSLSATDSNYRHYVELKGNVFTKEKVTAPFTEREVAYYEDTTYAVSEEVRHYTDKDGHHRSSTQKKEEKLSHECSMVPVYMRDDSYVEGICIDVESFGADADLQSGCDRMEQETSQWMQRHSHYRGMWGHGTGAKFLGYRLVEKVLLANQPIYVLGELYKQGNSYYVGHSRIGQKASKLSYKSEDELVAGNQSAKRMSWVIAAVAAVIGIIVISQNF